MVKVSLQNVRELSLGEIAELWAPELELPPNLVLRELLYGAVNIPRLKAGKRLIDLPPHGSELSNPNERVDREWVEYFCRKQGWKKPEFWFGKQQPVLRYVGRPSVKRAVLNKLKELAQHNELEDRLSEQARVLLEWADNEFPKDQIPTVRTIENQIRAEFNRLKRNPQN